MRQIFQIFAAENPEPKTELNYASDFELLIAVILSAQTTDRQVNLVTQDLFEKHRKPEDFLALGEAGLLEAIRSIGLNRAKSHHIIQTCAILIEKHHGKIPRTREALEALPGVGRKTANVILNTAFNEGRIAVDTHVFRVANRTGLAQGKTPLMVEHELLKIIDPQYRLNAHHWLVLHGRYTCKARKPECSRCSIAAFCDDFKKQP